MSVDPSDRFREVKIMQLRAIADEKLYITPFASDAEEIIHITTVPYPEWAGVKSAYIETFSPLADKIVYLHNPEILKDIFCPACGGTKRSDQKYCSDFFCRGKKDEALLKHISILQNQYRHLDTTPTHLQADSPDIRTSAHNPQGDRAIHGNKLGRRVFIYAVALIGALVVVGNYIHMATRDKTSVHLGMDGAGKNQQLTERQSEVCTASTRTNSGTQAAVIIYNVGGYGKTAKTRMDVVRPSSSRKQTEHTIIRSLTAYRWNTDEKRGYKFAVAPVPYREFFDIQHLQLSCKKWSPDNAIFSVPNDIKFMTVTKECPTGCP